MALEIIMKHPRKQATVDQEFRISDVFSRMGVAMEELMAAAPGMLQQVTVDGRKELQGKRKQNCKAA